MLLRIVPGGLVMNSHEDSPLPRSAGLATINVSCRCRLRCHRSFSEVEMFGLTAQMRRSAVSVPSKIAEGHGRGTDRRFGVFLSQAGGSPNELETQAELPLQLGLGAEQKVAA